MIIRRTKQFPIYTCRISNFMIEYAYKYTSSSSSMPIYYGVVCIVNINLLIIYKTELVQKVPTCGPVVKDSSNGEQPTCDMTNR